MDDIPATPNAPGFAGAFGFKMDPESATAGMKGIIDTAQQVSQAFGYSVSQSMMEQLADSAVFTDMLGGKIKAYLQGQVDSAASAAADLQQPIASSIVNQLGSVVEATAPMGVQIPQPGQEAPCPPCVVIRSSAVAGDLGPAFQCFRATALPLRDSRGVDYATRVDWIQRCLPPDIATHNAFAVGIAAIIQDPDSPAPTALPAFDAPPGAATGTPVPGAPAGPQTSGAVGQSDTPGIGSGAGIVAVNQKPVPSAGMIASLTVDQFVQQYGQPGTIYATWSYTIGLVTGYPTCKQINIFSASGGQVGGFMYAGIPAGQTSCGYVTSGPAPGPAPQPAPGPIPVPPPEPSTQQPPVTSPGIQQPLPPAQTPFAPRPNPSFIPEYPPGYVPPYQPVPYQPYNPPSYQSPQLPSCIPICNTDQQQQPQQPCLYTLVCGSDHVLYIIKATDSPRSSFDTILATGDPTSWDVTGAAKKCLIPKPSQPPPSGPGAPALRQILGCDQFGPGIGTDIAGGLPGLLAICGLTDAGGFPIPPFPDAGSLDVFQNIVNGIYTSGVRLLQNIFGAAEAIVRGSACATGDQLALMTTDAVLGFVSRFTGDAFEQVEIPVEQQRHFNCPTRLPSASSAASAWLGNTIDEATLECWTRADNFRYPEFKRIVDASRTKLSPAQYAVLQRRQWYDAPTAQTLIRNTGVTDPNDAAALYELTRQIPPASDLVRFMTRDAGDDALAAKFGLDTDFNIKFAGKIPEWAAQQGVDVDYMKYIWRAHWSIPAPGQLANMLHRLSRLPAGDPAFVDLATIRAAMEQQDIAPFWIDKFVAISYSPLTRIDARRAYEVGSLDEAGLKEAYLNLGYDDTRAQQLVDFNKVNIRRTFMRRSEVAQLARGEMTLDEFRAAMTQWGAQPDAIQAGIDRADILRLVASRKRCIDAYRRRFLQGEWNQEYATNLVVQQGVELQSANDIVKGWACEIDSKGKLFSYTQLNSLYSDGLITEVDYVQRATNLGFDNTEAVLMLRQIQRRLNIKIQTQQQKDLAAQQRAADRLARQLARQAAIDAANRAKAQKAVQQAQKLATLRTKRLTAAAEKFSTHSGLSLPDAIVFIQSIYRTAMNTQPVTNDEVIGALTVISGDKDVTTQEALVQALTTALTVQAS